VGVGSLTSLFLRKSPVLADVVAEVTTRHKVDNKVQIFAVFEGILHIDQEPEHEIRFAFLTDGEVVRGIFFHSLLSLLNVLR